MYVDKHLNVFMKIKNVVIQNATSQSQFENIFHRCTVKNRNPLKIKN